MTDNVSALYDMRAHEEAGHQITELPYDPDLGDNEFHCEDCNRTVGVPGWRGMTITGFPTEGRTS